MPTSAFLRFRSLTSALALALVVPAAAPALADARSDSNSAYVKGFQLYEAGDYRGARIQLLNALKANPNNGLARLMQARVALELGAGVQAQTELERAVQAGIPADKVRHLRAHALILQRKLSEAAALVAPQTIPPQFAAYAARMRGMIFTQQRQLDAAGKEFEFARQLAPNDPDTLVMLAQYRAATGDAKGANTLVDQVLAAKPTDGKALLAKGDLVRRAQGLEASLPYFNRALEADPNNLAALLERAATLGDLNREKEARADLKRLQGFVPDHPLALYLDAVMLTRGGKYQEARELMTRTKGQLNTYMPALLLQGLLAYQANDVAQASEFFGKVVAGAPQNVLARKLYAAAQLRRGDAQGAKQTLKPVIDAGAADGRVYALYGSAFARSGNIQEAQGYLQKAVEAAPKSGGLKTQLAMTELLQGDSDSAETLLQDVLKSDDKSLQALMVLTLMQLREGKYKEAFVTSNRIVKLYPDIPVGYNIKGGAQLALGQRDEAVKSFNEALQKKPNYVEARRNLAQVLLAQGKRAEAERELKKILETDKGDARALSLLAQIADQKGSTQERIEWLRQAAAADPKALPPRLQLADTYLSSGQTKRALDETSAILRDFPKEPNALVSAARVYERAGDKTRMESVLNRLVTENPNNPSARIMLARALESNRKIPAARSTYERALTLTGVNTAPLFVELIAFEARQNDLAAASRWADRLRKQAPRLNAADLAMGRAQLARGNNAEALKYFEAARKVSFNGPAARALADVYGAMGRPRDAIAIMQAYQKANPRDPVVLAAIAELQLGQRQYKAAIANYQALQKLPGGGRDPVVLNNLAWAYSQAGDKRALATARQAHAAAPNLPAVQDTYAWILIRNKQDPKLALDLLQRATRTSPNDPEIRFHLAVAYQANGQRAKAVEELKAALKSPRFQSRTAAATLLKQLSAG
jgi:putative PEP-CTERM system TPR-repeat lipoprotein